MSRTEKTAGKVKLTAREKKAVDKAIRQAKGDGKPHTAQDSIPFEVIYPDGICKLPGKSYSKSLRFLYKGIIIKHNKTEPTYTKTRYFFVKSDVFYGPD